MKETASPAPAYSTDPSAADRLIAELEARGVRTTRENASGLWYCTLWMAGAARERLATGSGKSWPLALCRAVGNLPSETVGPANAAAGLDSLPSKACSGCGGPLARTTSVPRYCIVCSYRLGKAFQLKFEARQRLRPRKG